MTIILADDGTLDTVLVCDKCNEEFRFCSDCHSDECTDESGDCACREGFISDIIEEVTSEHVCDA